LFRHRFQIEFRVRRIADLALAIPEPGGAAQESLEALGDKDDAREAILSLSRRDSGLRGTRESGTSESLRRARV
jgi:hypothetical protein